MNLYIDDNSIPWSSELIPLTEQQKVVYSQYALIRPLIFKKYPHLGLVVTKSDMGGEKIFIFVEFYKLTNTYKVSVLYHPEDMQFARDIYTTFIRSSKFNNTKRKMVDLV